MAEIWMDVDTALASVPVNLMPLVDDTDFKTIEDAVAYNAAGLALFWNFTTVAGVKTVTAVTPTSGGAYDWTDFSTSGMYGIEIPASGGGSINNDTEGFGYFTGVATGVLPFRGPVIGFRAAALNNALIDGGDTLDVNVTEINGGSAAAANLRRSAEGIYYGTVTGATTTTSLIDSALTQSATDFWKGRIVIFLTGALAGQATDITAFDAATDKLTYTATTSAASGGDTYVIV